MPRAAMAKKRKKGKEEEEEYEFRPPEFDEKEFIQKEIRDSKAVIITVIYAIGFSVLAGVISSLNHDLIGLSFIVVVVGILTLKPIYDLLGIDTKSFQKRNWAANIATFFFTFLAIWILLMNTPFADFSNPVVSKVIVWTGDDAGLEYTFNEETSTYSWVQVNSTHPATIVAGSNQTVNITAKVADNGKLNSVQIKVQASGSYVDMTRTSVDDRYEMKVVAAHMDAVFFISAVDSAGNRLDFFPQVGLPLA